MQLQYHPVKEPGAAKLAHDLVAAAIRVIASAGAAAGCRCSTSVCMRRHGTQDDACGG